MNTGPGRVFGAGFGSPFGSDLDIEELFGGMFGRTTGRARRQPVRGADQEAELELTIEEAYRGGLHSLTLSGPDGPRSLQLTMPTHRLHGRLRRSG